MREKEKKMSARRKRTKPCEVCGKDFEYTRYDAKVCSGACRQKKSVGVKTGQGKNWFAVRGEFREMANAIKVRVSDETYKGIETILHQFGAIAAEWAIATTWNAMQEYKFPNSHSEPVGGIG